MRRMEIVIDSECATYVGPNTDLQGYYGRVAHETPAGKWFTFRDMFLQGERVNTDWAYSYAETILPRLFGYPYYAPFVSVFVPASAILDRRLPITRRHRDN